MALSCGAIVGTGAGVSFWSFGILILPLEQEFGWLRGELSGAFSLSWLISGVVAPFVGRAVDRYGARPLILGGTLTSGLCFVLLAFTGTLWQFYLFQGLMAFCRAWMFYIPLSTLITRWFVRQRALALAIFTSGFAVGGVFFVPFLTFVVNLVGWCWTYLLCGAILYLVVLPLALWVLRSSPHERGLTPDGDPEFPIVGSAASAVRQDVLTAPEPDPRDLTVREALRTRAFWFIAVGFALTFFTQISFSVHAIPFFVSRGLTPGASAGVVSASTALVGLLRIPFGLLIDRTPNIRAIVLFAIFTQSLSFSVLLFSVEPLALWSFVLLSGLTGGGMPLLESALIFRTFGDRHYGALLGTVGLVETAGVLVGPIAAGAIYDSSGSYSWAIMLFLVTSLLAFSSFSAFRPRDARVKSAETLTSVSM